MAEGDTVDNEEDLSNPQVPVAPPAGAGEPQGSAPAPVDTTVPGSAEPKGDEPDKQSRRDARAFASLRRQNSELHRELGRLQGQFEAFRPNPPEGQTEQPGRSAPTEVERLRAEMAQQETERTARSFWTGAAKEAQEKGIDGFAEARDAMRSGEVPTTPAMSHYVTDVADNKAALVVWLADNPDEAERIASLSPVLVGAELAKADARLGAKPSPRTTRAPAPVRTVGGSSSAAQNDPSKMSMEDYAEWRAKRPS